MSRSSQLPPIAGEIDERVHAFLDRPLEGDWPYLWIDATYVKVREAGRIVSVAVIIAVAVYRFGAALRPIAGKPAIVEHRRWPRSPGHAGWAVRG